MTLKQWKDEGIRAFITSVMAICVTMATLAFKAPFMFKKSIENKIALKADKTELEKKADKTELAAHIAQQEKDDEEFKYWLTGKFEDLKDLIKANK